MPGEPVFLDTNVLLSATAERRLNHARARLVLAEWPNRGVVLYTSGQILREYLAVATRPADANGLALQPAVAVGNVRALGDRLRLLPEDEPVARRLAELVERFGCAGRQVHDANLVATMLVHGVPRLLTQNAPDFARFGELIEVEDLGGIGEPA